MYELSIRNSGADIIFPKINGLSSVSLYQHLLDPYTLPASIKLDLLCGIGWMCRESQPTPNWSGYMQHVCTSQPATICGLLFLPVINMNPADHFCMFFTRSVIKRQARELDIENACVTGTFDQPPWLKAVEILA